MPSHDNAYLDDLVARRTDVDCGSCRYVACLSLAKLFGLDYTNPLSSYRMVTIPEFEKLSNQEQTAILAKLEYDSENIFHNAGQEQIDNWPDSWTEQLG